MFGVWFNVSVARCTRGLNQAVRILGLIKNHKNFVLLKVLKSEFKTCGWQFLKRILYSTSKNTMEVAAYS